MKTIYQHQNSHFLVLKRGEELVSTLVDFCKSSKITAGYLTAIGACSQATLSWYDLGRKVYEDHEYKEGLEIVSLTGNIALLEGSPMLHIHGTFSKRDLSVVGGHIKLETFIEEFKREFDNDTGLNLLRD
jgi:predicted DNA-binding protein with PD1-like motif